MMAITVEELYAKEAKGRQSEAGRTKLPAPAPEAKGEARDQAAAEAGGAKATLAPSARPGSRKMVIGRFNGRQDHPEKVSENEEDHQDGDEPSQA
jgi:hypothetical protein